MKAPICGHDPARLIEVLARMPSVVAWVVGDIMLDEYVAGQVDRISPEAPVPVVLVRNVEYRLGGAANVARQVAALGAHASLAGLIGRDDAGTRILGLCKASGINTCAVRSLDNRPSSRKLRVLAKQQQMVRLDWEDPAPCPDESARWMLDCLEQSGMPDVIILSDYAKGVLTPLLMAGLMASARPRGVSVVVDPKRTDFSAYRGASLVKPNLRELELAIGRRFDPDDAETIAAAAQALARDNGVQGLIVTRGERGMIVAPAHEPWVSIAAHERDIFDATGAGDTVVAVLATAIACGATVGEAAHIANAAGGIVVGKVGAVSAEPHELIEALRDQHGRKVFERAELATKVKRWRAAGLRVVFTNGCFDLLHAGHLSLLHQAAACGDKLVLAVNSDTSVQRLKGPDRPVIPQHERAAMLAALSCVDAVTLFDEDTPLQTIEALGPDVLVKGQDYRIEQVVGRDAVETAGGQIILVPLLAEKSTTALIDRIAQRNRRTEATNDSSD